jgi:hypothetical protein
MKKIIVVLSVVFVAACQAYKENEQLKKFDLLLSVVNMTKCYVGSMKCEKNVAKLCNADGVWEDFRKCGALKQTCSMLPEDCSGYIGFACCK